MPALISLSSLASALMAAAPAPTAPSSAEPPPSATVPELVAQLAPCEDFGCPPLAALVKRGTAVWPELAIGLGTDQREMVRFWVLGVLSEVVVPESRQTLTALLADDPIVRIRAAAAFALGNHRHASVVGPLAAALSDSDVNVRFEAASALARSPGVAAVPALLKVIRDKDEDVRAAVLEALAAAGDPRAIVPVLRRAQRDLAARVRGTAAIALANLGAVAKAPELIERLTAETDPQALAAVCWALGELGAPAARAPLTALLTHADPVVVQHAKDALAALSKPRKKAAAGPAPEALTPGEAGTTSPGRR